MIRKLILLALVAASFAPAGIKAAAEPVHSKARKPYVLIMSGKTPNECLPGWVQSEVGPNVDIIHNDPHCPKLSAAEIAAAECVLFDIDARHLYRLTPADFTRMFAHYRGDGEFELMPGLVNNPNQALVINCQDDYPILVTQGFENLFGTNIFQMYRGIIQGTFSPWIKHVVHFAQHSGSSASAQFQTEQKPTASCTRQPEQERARFEVQQQEEADRQYWEQKEREAQQMKETDRQYWEQKDRESQQLEEQIKNAKDSLNETFHLLSDNDIAAQLIEYINQYNYALIDDIINRLKSKYKQLKDAEHISYIAQALQATKNQHPNEYAHAIQQFCYLQMF